MPTLSFFFLLSTLAACFPLLRRRRHHHHHHHTKPSILQFLTNLFSSSKSTPRYSSSLSALTTNSRSPPPPPSTNIHPCTSCGEIFQSSSLLDLHHSTTHHISPIFHTPHNIIRIIFQTGWPNPVRPPMVQSILKIHNHPKILARFEAHRDSVKSTAADSRCAADGNELLRFYCTTYVCDLDASVCTNSYCSVCGIIHGGFSPKLDGTATQATGYGAHASLPVEVEEEFRFMNVKRAMLVCRVVAGRVGCGLGQEGKGFEFDSVMATGGSEVGGGRLDDEDELVVFNPRAVLPCFVILYTTNV